MYKKIDSAVSNKLLFLKTNKEKYKKKVNSQLQSIEPTIEKIKKSTLDYKYYIKFGMLEQVFEYEDEGILIIKTKINSSYNNNATRRQNYYNIEDIIRNQGGSK